MTASISDLVMVYSGGGTNANPSLSLGGPPSSQPLTGLLDNLFRDITEDESNAGLIDYRCVYIFNNSYTSPLYNLQIYVSEQTSDGAITDLGIQRSFEIQRLALSNGTPTGGYITFSYPGKSDVIAFFNSNPGFWAQNIQNALNTVFEAVSVSASGSDNARTFDITFNGSDDYRFHDLLSVDLDALVPTNLTSSLSRVVAGSPINYIPDMLDSELTVPANVNFVTTSVNSTINIGLLNALEGFPLWFRRTCLPGTGGVQGDGISIVVSCSPISIY